MEAGREESANLGEAPAQAQGEPQGSAANQNVEPPPPEQGDNVPPQSEGGDDAEDEEDDEEETKNEDDELIEKAQKLMEKITSSPDNPNPTVLHALSSLLETQESL